MRQRLVAETIGRMGQGARCTSSLTAAVLAALLLTGDAVSERSRPPSLTITRASVDRAAHTIDLRLRICFSSGPLAMIAVNEQRTLHGIERATHSWIVPRGVEPDRIFAYACRTNWRVNWLLEPRLTGPGTYRASIRVRDAYRRWTPSVAVSVTSP